MALVVRARSPFTMAWPAAWPEQNLAVSEDAAVLRSAMPTVAPFAQGGRKTGGRAVHKPSPRDATAAVRLPI